MELFALSKFHKQYDSAVIAVLSHGAEETIYGSDGQPILVSQLVEYLNGENCRHLRGKPKFFIIQACRGSENK